MKEYIRKYAKLTVKKKKIAILVGNCPGFDGSLTSYRAIFNITLL
jgi:hypothetical protein